MELKPVSKVLGFQPLTIDFIVGGTTTGSICPMVEVDDVWVVFFTPTPIVFKQLPNHLKVWGFKFDLDEGELFDQAKTVIAEHKARQELSALKPV
jgi:hypothetical protein